MNLNEADEKQALQRFLQNARRALLWKLDGLPDYDIRRPMTPSGTNLLGLVKHCAGMECGYFGPLSGGMYATEAESREHVTDFYRRVWTYSDATIQELPLDARGTVPWWPEDSRHPTLHTVLLHAIQETARHAGHADIIRESIDGAAGLREGVTGMPPEADAAAWKQRYDKLERIARSAPATA